jgi:Tfp pilus assembly protein FimV
VTAVERPVRPFIAPFAFLAAATIAVLLLRPMVHPKHGTPAVSTTEAAPKAKAVHAAPTTYTVHAGDTLDGIAAKTGVPTATLQKLNPGLSATSLFLGQKVRLR